jgi:hypothetical protein
MFELPGPRSGPFINIVQFPDEHLTRSSVGTNRGHLVEKNEKFLPSRNQNQASVAAVQTVPSYYSKIL